MSMQHIKETDLVRDEYGNYYKVVGIHTEGDTLKALEVSNLYFETSFQHSAESLEDDYKSKPVGVFIQEQVNAYIDEVQQNERPIYGIRDLMVNRIKVYAVDITQPHPLRNQTV
ncbi:hypothetical protein [Planomicrobium sp. CPCC 101110]|uniref:hypothetical protein n=1 Tax=Planomicrobium sp. CPCC 101110 TaxID=2599619 RepID=UPI0011B6587F|nr:hypothetical protein [Planomicrobium sp. CPCC 101110]TWT25234.1 hypothetical protein FQV30_12765 [Planomicrobium sp. CPCC 101110]